MDRLAEAGASGLGIGLGMSGPPITPELFSRAGERGLPVVTVPYSMPFTTVVRAVAANDIYAAGPLTANLVVSPAAVK